MTFDEQLDAILSQIRATLLSKRHDYGPGNLADFGEFGILVRQGDKYHRLKNLLMGGQAPANESVTDTWLDMAGYAVLALMLREVGAETFVGLPVAQGVMG